MFATRFIEELRARCPFITELPQTLQSALATAIEKICDGCGIVTREEFDIQVAVLARTQAKIAELEARLARQTPTLE